MLICFATSGCAFSRDSLTDRPTQMEPRISVDDLADENSGFEAVNSKNSKSELKAPSLPGRTSGNRSKLASWREANNQSVRLDRTDQTVGDQQEGTNPRTRQKTAAVSSGRSSDTTMSPMTTKNSPFSNAFDNPKADFSRPTGSIDNSRRSSSSDTPEDDAASDPNPFD